MANLNLRRLGLWGGIVVLGAIFLLADYRMRASHHLLERLEAPDNEPIPMGRFLSESARVRLLTRHYLSLADAAPTPAERFSILDRLAKLQGKTREMESQRRETLIRIVSECGELPRAAPFFVELIKNDLKKKPPKVEPKWITGLAKLVRRVGPKNLENVKPKVLAKLAAGVAKAAPEAAIPLYQSILTASLPTDARKRPKDVKGIVNTLSILEDLYRSAGRTNDGEALARRREEIEKHLEPFQRADLLLDRLARRVGKTATPEEVAAASGELTPEAVAQADPAKLVDLVLTCFNRFEDMGRLDSAIDLDVRMGEWLVNRLNPDNSSHKNHWGRFVPRHIHFLALAGNCTRAAELREKYLKHFPKTLFRNYLDQEVWYCKGEGKRPQVIDCHQLTAAPRIDGRLDTVWEEAAPIPMPTATEDLGTVARMGHYGGELFLWVRCPEPDMEGIKATIVEEDGPTWQDDCIELFLDPDRSLRRYYQAVFNTLGVVCSGKDYARISVKGPTGMRIDLPAWSPQCRVAVAMLPAEWNLEVSVPLASIGLAQPKGKIIRFNIRRFRHRGGKGGPSRIESVCPVGGASHFVENWFLLKME